MAVSSKGINRKVVAKRLASLAKRIQSGRVDVCSVASHQFTRDERFPVITFRVSYTRKKGS